MAEYKSYRKALEKAGLPERATHHIAKAIVEGSRVIEIAGVNPIRAGYSAKAIKGLEKTRKAFKAAKSKPLYNLSRKPEMLRSIAKAPKGKPPVKINKPKAVVDFIVHALGKLTQEAPQMPKRPVYPFYNQ